MIGFGALNYYLKILGFFMIVIAPILLVIVSVLFPTPPEGKFSSGEIKGKPIIREYVPSEREEPVYSKEKDS